MIDNNFINELYEEEIKSQEQYKVYQEGLVNAIKKIDSKMKELDTKHLFKFLSKCANKILDNKNKYKYFCILEERTTRVQDTGYAYYSYPVIWYALYASNTPFKKEMLNEKIIRYKVWKKEFDVKRLSILGYDSNTLIRLSKEQFPDNLKNCTSNLSVIYHNTNPFVKD